jgi:hypothetical protein
MKTPEELRYQIKTYGFQNTLQTPEEFVEQILTPKFKNLL